MGNYQNRCKAYLCYILGAALSQSSVRGNRESFHFEAHCHGPQLGCSSRHFTTCGQSFVRSTSCVYEATSTDTHVQTSIRFLLNHLVHWPPLANLPDEHKLIHTVLFGEIVGVDSRDDFKKRIMEELQVWMVDFSWESFACFEGSFNELRILILECHGSLKSFWKNRWS